ncbi:MAG: type II toxin-antitoxin system VapC family toxin [Ignavibacteriales bacterium]|nr:type II toxin-antitoxin system VapC family toxin [Ignavibacteriales bacterium]
MYLVDSNIWLELLLEQEKQEEVREFLNRLDGNELSITEFSLYSIGLILTQLKKQNLFEDFLTDTIMSAGVHCVRLTLDELKELLLMTKQHLLDFDDAYQYTVAEKYDLHIVSFDTDFDRTPRGRMTPQQVLKTITP